jgi:predicted  nucleic acid-binding Zn-ribbon protein
MAKMTNRNMTSAMDEYRHANTTVINSRRRVLEFEAEEVEKSIFALSASLGTMRERRAKISAQLAGLEAVVAKR